ncbi:iron ABC transporter [Hydrogenovibrio sp. SC-1]|uniref:FecCD family ABC transporter permease n=1 Tax=Hydrogenovibrio sp. SC-1 TaxID=2065820 RepID=UPI000C79A255|nr:iron ABC transporter permease [Hydrogenovibrio sp. SC-1]PLA74622.1 iron ABC transporter [Hydrogenovibrio sp. SC-1]
MPLLTESNNPLSTVLKNPPWLLFWLGVFLFVLAFYSLSIGAMSITPYDLLASLIGQADQPQTAMIITEIRLPRVVLAILVGAGLGISGAAMQGLFRNPLADPGLVGVSSGAALGAVMIIVLGATWFHGWLSYLGAAALPLAAFLGGLAVTSLIYRLATRNGRTDVGLMLLAGVALNAMSGAAIGLLSYFASAEQLRSLTFWSLGSLASADWSSISMVSVPILLAVIWLPFSARGLNAFLMGEAVSKHMGYNVKQLKWMVIGLTALAVGAAVSVSGVIGFVGLVAPHIVRSLTGPDHRWVMPGSALVGALLVLGADLIARSLLAPSEIPIGIIMSAIGGPFFLWLLMQRRPRVGF